jgi:hypothetical protein
LDIKGDPDPTPHPRFPHTVPFDGVLVDIRTPSNGHLGNRRKSISIALISNASISQTVCVLDHLTSTHKEKWNHEYYKGNETLALLLQYQSYLNSQNTVVGK